jgi:Sulfotransferase family
MTGSAITMAPDAYVFLFGAPRSGTTWLQNMLGSRSEIVTPQESNLFNYYIGPWWREWLKAMPDWPDDWHNSHRYTGLSTILTQDEFAALLGDVVERVYGKVLSRKPTATIVLDKVPNYTFFGPVIRRCLPEARFIHLIRDGRDVARSMERASRGFGDFWAPSRVDDAAWQWKSNVEAGRQMTGPGYLELRFEALRSDSGAELLREAFSFCGVDLSPESSRDILDRFSIERTSGRPPSSISWGGEVVRRLGGSPDEPDDFFGTGTVGGWAGRFSAYERWLFDREAGDLLVELGYEPDRSWARVPAIARRPMLFACSLARWRKLVSRASARVRRNLRGPRRNEPEVVVPPGVAFPPRGRP